jgi:membrane-bound lytic murein transglycosylase A
MEETLWRWQHSGAGAPPPPAQRIAFDDISGWREDDHCAALACYLKSIALAAAPLPKPGGVSLLAMLADRDKARRFFEENFVAFRILAEPGLLTSYFEPVLPGSRTQTPRFRIPVYRRPADLEPLPQGHSLAAAGLTAGRKTDDGFEAYATRAEIEAGALQGRDLELLYLDDAIDAFIMHVQGSGRIEFEDGTATRLTFDGKNGHLYTSIARRLIERGALKAENADLAGMVAWLRAQPHAAATLNENKSYIFFKELEPPCGGPRGSMGAELSPGRSLAADPLYHAPGIPIWVDAPSLMFDGRPFRRLAIAQDTGSAIRGPQRGDIFSGSGAGAGRAAGRARHACDFIVLRPR